MEHAGNGAFVALGRLEDCTFREAVALWNDVFSDYYFDMTMTMERYVVRMGKEGIRPDLSVVAYVDGRPVGFVLIALKTVGGIKVAWNGGTGVIPSLRGKGIGKRMVRETVRMMREEGVGTVILEAMTQNASAVAAYASEGFRIADRIAGMKREGVLSGLTGGLEAEAEAGDRSVPPGAGAASPYRAVPAKPAEIGRLPFYRNEAAWSSQWYNLTGGDGLIVYDADGIPAAYALTRRTYGDDGKLLAIVLYQCETDPFRPDRDAVVPFALAAAFGPPEAECVRRTENLSVSDGRVTAWLEASGFETVYTQYLMMLDFGTEADFRPNN